MISSLASLLDFAMTMRLNLSCSSAITSYVSILSSSLASFATSFYMSLFNWFICRSYPLDIWVWLIYVWPIYVWPMWVWLICETLLEWLPAARPSVSVFDWKLPSMYTLCCLGRDLPTLSPCLMLLAFYWLTIFPERPHLLLDLESGGLASYLSAS